MSNNNRRPSDRGPNTESRDNRSYASRNERDGIGTRPSNDRRGPPPQPRGSQTGLSRGSLPADPRIPSSERLGSTTLPNTQAFHGFETAVPDRRRAQAAQEPSVSQLLEDFLDFDLSDFSSCVAFCQDNDEIWREDYDSLHTLARFHLQKGDRNSQTMANIALQRFFMLSGQWHHEGDKDELDYLRSLLNFEAARNSLDKTVRAEKQRLQAPSLSGGTSTQPSQPAPQGRPTQQAIPAQGALARREDVETSRSRPGATVFQSARNQPGTQARQSQPGLVGQSTELRSQREDLDTLGPLESGIVGPRKFVGPATDVGNHLLGQDRLDYFTEFHKDYTLQIGDKRIEAAFSPGCVIATVWHETFGESLPKKLKDKVQSQPLRPGRWGPGFLSRVENGSWVYSHVKRFIVIKKRHGFSTGIPITSYSQKGLSEKKISNREKLAHAIVYSKGSDIISLTGEPNFNKKPICIQITRPGESISIASRVYYAAPSTIEHNVRIKYIGHVIEEHMSTLLKDYVFESER